MAEVDSLNGNLEQTVEAYNYANIQLQQIDDDLASNAKHLVAAKKSLVVSQERIAERLRDLYINGQGDSTLEVILGSSSLDDIIARLDAIERVSSQDAQILRTVKRYRKEVETRRANLEKARAESGADRRGAGSAEAVDRVAARGAEPLARRRSRTRSCRCARKRRAGRPLSPLRPGSARKLRPLAQQAQQDTADQAYDADATTPRRTTRTCPRPSYGRCRLDRAAVPRRPVRVGRLEPVDRIRLLGLHELRLSRRSASTCPTTRRRSTACGTPVPYDQLAPGDLVFFSGLGHVGIYIGGGQFVHAPHTGDVVKISSLAEHGSYVGARRL